MQRWLIFFRLFFLTFKLCHDVSCFVRPFCTILPQHSFFFLLSKCIVYALSLLPFRSIFDLPQTYISKYMFIQTDKVSNIDCRIVINYFLYKTIFQYQQKIRHLLIIEHLGCLLSILSNLYYFVIVE